MSDEAVIADHSAMIAALRAKLEAIDGAPIIGPTGVERGRRPGERLHALRAAKTAQVELNAVKARHAAERFAAALAEHLSELLPLALDASHAQQAAISTWNDTRASEELYNERLDALPDLRAGLLDWTVSTQHIIGQDGNETVAIKLLRKVR